MAKYPPKDMFSGHSQHAQGISFQILTMHLLLNQALVFCAKEKTSMTFNSIIKYLVNLTRAHGRLLVVNKSVLKLHHLAGPLADTDELRGNCIEF